VKSPVAITDAPDAAASSLKVTAQRCRTELAEIAGQVKRAAGPSGTNLQYVLELHAVLRALGIDDPHVAELASLLLRPSAPPPVQPEARGEQAEAHAQPRRAG